MSAIVPSLHGSASVNKTALRQAGEAFFPGLPSVCYHAFSTQYDFFCIHSGGCMV